MDDPLNEQAQDEPALDEQARGEESQAVGDSPLAEQLTALQDDLRQGLIALGQKITRLERHFETKIMYDQSKDETINALHRELETHREGMAFVHLRPLVNDVLTLYDDLGDLLAGFAEEHPDVAGQDAVRVLLNGLETIREDLGYTLEKYGFELFEHPGEAVDRSVQRVQMTIPTDDPARDRTVARRLRRGLRYEGRVVRPEVVAAYRYAPPAGDSAETE
ncbi:MAG: hypothetical protein Kow0077_00360 [Anaerolineae bacterium]